jgi:hypothetical protein
MQRKFIKKYYEDGLKSRFHDNEGFTWISIDYGWNDFLPIFGVSNFWEKKPGLSTLSHFHKIMEHRSIKEIALDVV